MLGVRKRAIIAGIIAVIILVLAKNFWLIFKPIKVDIDFEIKNPLNVCVVLNKHDDDFFSKVKRANLVVKNGINEFLVEDLFLAKRLRIDFANANQKIVVKDISINNKRFVSSKFKLQGGILKIENNNLIIYPKSDNVRLYCEDSLQIFRPAGFEISIFIIILVLSFLLFYKLIDYAADFSTLKSKSRIEIVFLSIFFVLLCLPALNIDKNNISKKENRVLKKYSPMVTQEGKINYNYGKDFNAWFSDRFFLRRDLIDLYYNQFIIAKNLRTRKVIKGKDNWLFYGINSAVDSYTNKNTFSNEDLELAKKRLEEINNLAKARHKEFYFVIAPSKAKVYSEFYSELIRPQKDSISLSEQLVSYLKENSDVRVIYLKDNIIKNKDKGILYYKKDTHWNKLGAYFGYLDIMKIINKDFKNPVFNYKKLIDDNDIPGDLNASLPTSLKIKEDIQYKKPYVEGYSCQKTQNNNDIQYCSGKGTKKILMFRDSFAINLIPYISTSFKKSKYVWQYDVDFSYMDDADIVILEMVEINLLFLIKDNMEEV